MTTIGQLITEYPRELPNNTGEFNEEERGIYNQALQKRQDLLIELGISDFDTLIEEIRNGIFETCANQKTIDGILFNKILSAVDAIQKIYWHWPFITLSNRYDKIEYVVPVDTHKTEVLLKAFRNEQELDNKKNATLFNLPNNGTARFHTRHDFYRWDSCNPSINATIETVIGQYVQAYRLAKEKKLLLDFFLSCRHTNACMDGEARAIRNWLGSQTNPIEFQLFTEVMDATAAKIYSIASMAEISEEEIQRNVFRELVRELKGKTCRKHNFNDNNDETMIITQSNIKSYCIKTLCYDKKILDADDNGEPNNHLLEQSDDSDNEEIEIQPQPRTLSFPLKQSTSSYQSPLVASIASETLSVLTFMHVGKITLIASGIGISASTLGFAALVIGITLLLYAGYRYGQYKGFWVDNSQQENTNPNQRRLQVM